MRTKFQWKALISLFMLIVTSAAGLAGLHYFWNTQFKPGDFSAFSLPLVSFTAGLAATFNPCALPTLPAFLTRMSGGERAPLGRQAAFSLFAGLGAFVGVLILGLLIAAFGEGLKPFVQENFHWIQLVIGISLILLAGLHLLGQTARLPFVGRVMDRGHQIWEQVIRNPTPGGSFAFGIGFVLVGAGWTGPFLAVVAAFALGSGGFWAALFAFLIFASTLGGLVVLVSILGSASSPALARTLRRGGRQIQIVGGSLIVLIGSALVYASFFPGFFPSLLLK